MKGIDDMLLEATYIEGVAQFSSTNFCINHGLKLDDFRRLINHTTFLNGNVKALGREGWQCLDHTTIVLSKLSLECLYYDNNNHYLKEEDERLNKDTHKILSDLIYILEELIDAYKRGASIEVSSI